MECNLISPKSGFWRWAVVLSLMLLPGIADAVKIQSSWNSSGDSVQYVLGTGRTGGSVWGSSVYTNDSDIWTAAVHAGVLSSGKAGILKITALPGQSSYQGSTKNGVTTTSYGSWSGSFSLSGWSYNGETIDDPTNLYYWRGMSGTYNFSLVGTGSGSVWGTDTYTDDSLLAKAAVHAGKLAVGQSGVVAVTLANGLSSYVGSTRNGVSTSSYGSFGGSYNFGTIPTTPVISSANSATATVGQAFSYQIQASGSPLTYSATGLPSGLSLDSSTGLISGTPGSAGSHSVQLGATNSAGTGNATLTISISQASSTTPPTGTTGSSAERVFNWAEATYPELFSPAKQTTKVIFGYTYRYYSNTNSYLATRDDGRVYYLGAFSQNQIMDVGSLSSFLALAQAAGY